MSRAVVIKVGGSLFDWPDLPGRLAACLEGRASRGERPVLLAGGGRAADLVRDLDRAFAIGDVRAHRMALRSLDFTAHLLAAIVPALDVVDELGAIEAAWGRGRIPILAPSRFLIDDEGVSPDPLPPSWDVTSDSIAARLAVRLGAQSLVLLKSAPLPPGIDRREAARLGLVDPAFPAASRVLRDVVYLNLRETPCIPHPLPLPPAR